MKLIPYPSKNFDQRDWEIDMLILHYTGMESAAEAIDRLCDPEAKVSAHYVVDENGDVYQLVDEANRAWHAGVSFWRGRRNLNANSIGIEIINPGHEFGYRQFTEEQYAALLELCAYMKEDYNIPNINILGHSDVAPDRKDDPGELFDWKRLADNGIGLWPREISEYDAFKFLENNRPMPSLADLGYEHHNERSIIAFQRHWRQNKVNGLWDDECQGLLHSLLQQIQ